MTFETGYISNFTDKKEIDSRPKVQQIRIAFCTHDLHRGYLLDGGHFILTFYLRNQTKDFSILIESYSCVKKIVNVAWKFNGIKGYNWQLKMEFCINQYLDKEKHKVY
jgi:hypothetical protein